MPWFLLDTIINLFPHAVNLGFLQPANVFSTVLEFGSPSTDLPWPIWELRRPRILAMVPKLAPGCCFVRFQHSQCDVTPQFDTRFPGMRDLQLTTAEPWSRGDTWR